MLWQLQVAVELSSALFAKAEERALDAATKIVLQISTLSVEFQHKQISKKIKLSIA
jgi:hypothetical protein